MKKELPQCSVEGCPDAAGIIMNGTLLCGQHANEALERRACAEHHVVLLRRSEETSDGATDGARAHDGDLHGWPKGNIIPVYQPHASARTDANGRSGRANR